MFKFKTYNSFSDELKLIWEEFENISTIHVFQTYTWCKHWFETVGKHEKYSLNIIEITDECNGKLMLLPLVKKRILSIWKLEWMGGIQFDYHAPICIDNFFWTEKIFKKMMDQFKKMLEKDNITFLHLITQPQFIHNYNNPFYTYLNSYDIQKSSHIEFRHDEDYFKKESLKKILSDSNRQRKRLTKIGQIKFNISQNEFDFNFHVEKMISQKQIQYIENNIGNLLKKSHIKDFYKLSNNKTVQYIQMATLEINNKIVATHWGAVYNKRFYYMMPSYERGEMSKYSTGKLLLEELIKWSIDNNFNSFDFTIGGEMYKKDWCNSEMFVSKSIVPITLFGKILSLYIIYNDILVKKILELKKLMTIYRYFKKIAHS